MLADNITTIKSQYHKSESMVAPLDAASRHSKSEQKAKEQEMRAEEPEMKISQALLNDVQHEIQKMHNIELKFSMHEATGQTMVKVVDKETEKLIREIPPEDLLNLADKIDEMIGILFDKKV